MKPPILILAMLAVFSLSAQPEFTQHPVVGNNLQGDVYFADIDNDGDIDILLISHDAYLGWHENLDGASNFAPFVVLFELDVNTNSVDIKDFDNDGDVDVLATESQNHLITWYENIDGAGEFGTRQILVQDVESPQNAMLVDLDQDGDLDILGKGSVEQEIFWNENTDGQGTMGPKNVLLSDINTQNFIPGDLDNDGDLDIVFTYQRNTSWIENLDGQGSFSSEQSITVSSSLSVTAIRKICLIDLDNDGDLDVATSTDTELVWNENLDLQSNFGPDQTIRERDGFPIALLAHDLDNDGDDDLLHFFRDTQFSYDRLWFENTEGPEQLDLSPNSFTNFPSPSNVYLEDLNADGVVEIVTKDARKGELVIWSKSETLPLDYENPVVLNSASVVGAITPPLACDLDSDGDLDMLFASGNLQQIAWSENVDGTGTFEKTIPIDNDLQEINHLNAVDLDNDGDLEVIATVRDGNFWGIKIYENLDGLGNFNVPPTAAGATEQITKVEAVDLDNDGDLDLVYGIFGDFGQSGKVYFSINQGNLNFGFPQLVRNTRQRITDIDPGDFNQDGLTDLAVYSFAEGGGASFSIYQNNGIGNDWTTNSVTNSPFNTFFHNSTTSVNDLDGDSDLDLILSVTRNQLDIRWFENSEPLGDFPAEQEVTNNSDTYYYLASGDMDNDGDIDIISAVDLSSSTTWEVVLYENIDGQGEFSEKQVLFSQNFGITDLSLADINNNGTLDIIMSSGTVEWYENSTIAKNKIIGLLAIDINEDDCTTGSVPMPHKLVSTNNGVDTLATFSAAANGKFQFNVNEGNFTTAAISDIPNFSVSPSSIISSFPEPNSLTDTIQFCYQIEEEIVDLSVQLIPLTEARPGFMSSYVLVFQNQGTSIENGTVSFEFDPASMELLTTSETPLSVSDGLIEFAVTDFSLFENRRIQIDMQILAPPAVNFGENLSFTARIESPSGDINEADNLFTLEQLVIGAYDPNDISVREGTEILAEETDEFLHYLIRFQNTGNASAINVRVENKLDYNLDPQTLELEGLSHDYRVEIINNHMVSFIFDNIHLPDSLSDEAASHGYIAYRIKPIADIAVGDHINNTASIYFDFNEPIITNTVTTTVVEPVVPVITYEEQTSCEPFTWIDGMTYTESVDSLVYVFPEGAVSGADSILVLNLSIIIVNTAVSLVDNTITATAPNATYQWVDCDTGLPLDGETSVSFTAASNGAYAVDITENTCTERSECISIVGVNTKDYANSTQLIVLPNPFQNSTIFRIKEIPGDHGTLKIFDTKGILLISKMVTSNTDVTFKKEGLASGIYFYEVVNEKNERVFGGKVVKY